MKLHQLTALIAIANAQGGDETAADLDFGQYCEDNRECKDKMCCA